jgi:hypothetical protein
LTLRCDAAFEAAAAAEVILADFCNLPRLTFGAIGGFFFDNGVDGNILCVGGDTS